ncbi:hypothetical protein MBLNU457_g0279t2 [Dothideomycetes sp. NU457]
MAPRSASRDICDRISFLLDFDFEQRSWDWPEASFNVVRMCMLSGCVTNYQSLYQTAWKFVHFCQSTLRYSSLHTNRYCKLGVGYIEHIEIDFKPRCDNGTLRADSAIAEWWRAFSAAMDLAGKSVRISPETTIECLGSAGFINVQQTTVKLPWRHNLPSKHGRSSFPQDSFMFDTLLSCRGLQAMSLRPLTRYLKMEFLDVHHLLTRVAAEMENEIADVYSLV